MDKGFLRIGKWFFKPQDLEEKSLGSRSVHVSHVSAEAPGRDARRSHASELDALAAVWGRRCSSDSRQITRKTFFNSSEIEKDFCIHTWVMRTSWLTSHCGLIVGRQWEEEETQGKTILICRYMFVGLDVRLCCCGQLMNPGLKTATA